jgi:hypothetical protein
VTTVGERNTGGSAGTPAAHVPAAAHAPSRRRRGRRVPKGDGPANAASEPAGQGVRPGRGPAALRRAPDVVRRVPGLLRRLPELVRRGPDGTRPIASVPHRTRAAVRRGAAALRTHARANPLFTVVLAVAVLLRAVTMLGYRPIMWFNDSYEYVAAALRLEPYVIRPDGYSFFLLLLEPLHSFALVAGLQHLMGLAIAVMIYAVLRRKFRLPKWGATLAAVPVLFDAYQIQLEHLVLSDVLFTFLMVTALTLLLWHDSPSWRVTALVGLLLSMATLTRTVGLPVLLVAIGYLVIRRVGWRPLTAALLACAIPLLAYSTWFYSWHGKFNTTNSSGIFLYSRTMDFADCGRFKPPVEEIPLCTEVPPAERPMATQFYIWSERSPLHRLPGKTFDETKNQLASDLAKRAIVAQPGDYAQTIAKDFFRVFEWRRTTFPDKLTYSMYEFGTKEKGLPNWVSVKGGTAASDARLYERGRASTDIAEPFAAVIRGYQDVFYMRGSMLGAILLIGLAGMIPLWRRLGGVAMLPWITAVGLLLAPAATAEFDYRYVIPTVPLACLAAAITFSTIPRSKIAGWFRRRTSKGVSEEAPAKEEPAPALVGN